MIKFIGLTHLIPPNHNEETITSIITLSKTQEDNENQGIYLKAQLIHNNNTTKWLLSQTTSTTINTHNSHLTMTNLAHMYPIASSNNLYNMLPNTTTSTIIKIIQPIETSLMENNCNKCRLHLNTILISLYTWYAQTLQNN